MKGDVYECYVNNVKCINAMSNVRMLSQTNQCNVKHESTKSSERTHCHDVTILWQSAGDNEVIYQCDGCKCNVIDRFEDRSCQTGKGQVQRARGH